MHPQDTTDLATFYDGRAHYVVDAAGCWLWQGGLTRAGYGQCSPWTEHRFAHRWYYARFCGPLNKAQQVHHTCGVPRCVNPAHLEAVTPQENLARREHWRGRRPWPRTPAQPAAPVRTDDPEEWRAIPWLDGLYSVSNLGRVRRDKQGRGARAGRILRPIVDKKGYVRVVLHNNHRYTEAVHRLVAAAFVRLPMLGEQINHLNGNKSDNRPCNLEWCTGQQNMRHAVKNGLRPDQSGPRNGRAKLTLAQVQEIRELRGTTSQVAIAARYGVAQSQVSAIQLRVTWRDQA